jgi:hypothetical protein
MKWIYDSLAINRICSMSIHTDLGGRGEQPAHHLVLTLRDVKSFYVGDVAWRKDTIKRRGLRLGKLLADDWDLDEAAKHLKLELIDYRKVTR